MINFTSSGRGVDAQMALRMHFGTCIVGCLYVCVCLWVRLCGSAVLSVWDFLCRCLRRVKISICYRIFFPSPLLSLLSLLHYTPISLGWIKWAIKTFIHVSVKNIRHINGMTQWAVSYPQADFTAFIFVSFSFIVVYIFRCAFLCFHTCIHPSVYVKKKTEM